VGKIIRREESAVNKDMCSRGVLVAVTNALVWLVVHFQITKIREI
jgi:hypothetical protein